MGLWGSRHPSFLGVSLSVLVGSVVSWGPGDEQCGIKAGSLSGCTHHDPSAEADNLAPYGTRHHVPVADGEECDGDQPQCV